MSGFSFSKSERLASRRTISSVFQSGRAVYAPPLKLLFLEAHEISHPALAAVTVPKRLYKRAVDRNLLKRRIRESYRLNKGDFYKQLSEAGVQLYLVIQYQHKKITDYQSIESGLLKGFEQVLRKLEKSL